MIDRTLSPALSHKGERGQSVHFVPHWNRPLPASGREGRR